MLTPNPYLRLAVALLFTLLSFSAHADDSSLLELELPEEQNSALEFWALDDEEENLSELTSETFFASAPVVGVAALPAFVKYVGSVAQALNGKTVKMILAAGAVFAVVGSKIYSLTSEPSLGMDTELTIPVLQSMYSNDRDELTLNYLRTLQKKIKNGGPEEEKQLLADLREDHYEVTPYHHHMPITIVAKNEFRERAINELAFRQKYYAQTQDLAGWKRMLMDDISFTLQEIQHTKAQYQEDYKLGI